MFFKQSPPILVLLSAWGWVLLFGYLSHFSGWRLVLGFLLGVCMYTFNEFFIHKVLFHIVSKKVPWPQRLYYKVHGSHHQYAESYSRVVLPLAHQWGLVAIMTLLFHLFLSLPLGLTFQFTCVLGSGLMFGYSLYEIAHLYAHGHPLVSWMKFLEVSKDFHWYHHYKNSRTSFGFCSPFWDWVFQTMPQEPDGYLNPFLRKKSADGEPLSLAHRLAALPLPVPFYHWVTMYLRFEPKPSYIGEFDSKPDERMYE